MDVKTMDAGRQGFQIRGKQQAIRGFTDGDRADRLRCTVGADQIDGDFFRRRLCAADEPAYAGTPVPPRRPIRRVIANPDDIARYVVEFYSLAKSVKGAAKRPAQPR